MKKTLFLIICLVLLIVIIYNPIKVQLEYEKQKSLENVISTLFKDIPKSQAIFYKSSILNKDLLPKIRMIAVPHMISIEPQKYKLLILDKDENISNKYTDHQVLKTEYYKKLQLILLRS